MIETTIETTNAAMDRIRDEMAKTKNRAAGMLGELITLLLPRHPEWAEAMADKSRSLSGAYQAMYDAAKKDKINAMTDAEGLSHALTHYGIQVAAETLNRDLAEAWRNPAGAMPSSPEPQEAQEAPEPQETTEPEPPQAPADDMDLDKLLEGL